MPTKRITVTLTPEITEDLIDWIGEDNEVDHEEYVNAVVSQFLERERLAELVAQLEEECGDVSPEQITELDARIEAQWPTKRN